MPESGILVLTVSYSYAGEGPATRRSLDLADFTARLLRLRTACRRDDAVHSQIFDHLSVMVERMCGGERADAATRQLHSEKIDHLQLILFADRCHRFMEICKRVLQELHDFGFALDRIGTILAAGINGRL